MMKKFELSNIERQISSKPFGLTCVDKVTELNEIEGYQFNHRKLSNNQTLGKCDTPKPKNPASVGTR